MKLTTFAIVLLAAAIALVAIPVSRAQTPSSYELYALPPGATLHRVEAAPAEYKGRKAIKVEMPDAAIKAQLGIDVDMPTFVRIPVDFRNGTIEVDILSRLNGKGPPDARAFVGISYRITDPEAHFETIYLRPLNGRKKNPPSPRDKRAVQYFAYPDWKFDRLRKEYPDGHYESGADIADDEWTTLRLDIDGTRVRVSVNGKDELALADAKGTSGRRHRPVGRHGDGGVFLGSAHHAAVKNAFSRRADAPLPRRIGPSMMSHIGTTRTFRNVRYSVAVECKADIESHSQILL